MRSQPQRMWINQPSTLQEAHSMHGTNVLAVHEYDHTYRVYFLSGQTISRQMRAEQLSHGWREDNQPCKTPSPL